MVKLNFDHQAYQFEQGLKAIELMWLSARQALDTRLDEVSCEISRYRKFVELGGKPIGEWDGQNRLWDKEDLLRLDMLTLDDAHLELNRATTILIYHHWERHVPYESPKKRQHQDLVNCLVQSGIDVHKDINALSFAANFLKHGNPVWLEKLSEQFLDQFPELQSRKHQEQPWGILTIKPTQLEWFLEIAKTSKRPIFGNP